MHVAYVPGVLSYWTKPERPGLPLCWMLSAMHVWPGPAGYRYRRMASAGPPGQTPVPPVPHGLLALGALPAQSVLAVPGSHPGWGCVVRCS